ncbi:DUF3732 domain-containing protein [Flavobacterium sp. DGU11]|uniref:DUF3732 domain-containing protein n=1 Tax=Flavobacterium arundinis TaxID=3139143 RepID=A0ABU9HTD6_9FLAO
MILKIKTIALYPVDKNLKPRFIRFEEDKVNVITGYSKRGKSSIIEIIDYCLGNTDANIPIGRIRNLVDKFALNLNINGQYVFIARDSPKSNQQSSDNMYYIEYDKKGEYVELNSNDWIANSEQYKVSKARIKEILNLKAGFLNIEESISADKSLTVGFRDTSAFQFQPQSIVANGNTIFYKTDTFEHLNRLKILFPLALGYKSYEILLLENEMNIIETEEKKLQNKIDDLSKRYENWKYDIYQYYNEAISLGLSNSDINIESSSVDLIKDELKSIVKNVRNNKVYQEGSGIRFSEKLEEHDFNRLNLMRELQNLKMEYNKIEQFDRAKNEYISEVSHVIEKRLKPVDWFLSQNGTDICPFCDSKSDKALIQLQKLSDEREQNTKLISQSESNYFSFDKEKQTLKKEIRDIEKSVVEIDRSIDVLLKEKTDYHLKHQGIYEFAGKISNVIESIEIFAPDGKYNLALEKLQKDLAQKNKDLLKLKKKFDKENSLNKLTKTIKNYVNILPIEDRNESNVLLDPEKYIGIKIENKNTKTISFLNKIGSGSNYMCYHLATMLGLHEFFYKLPETNKKNYIPSFLVLDQPSQVYFPEGLEDDANETSDDFENTKKIFEVCSKFMERTNNNIQIIILEHAPSSVWKDIEHINKVEEWRGKFESDDSYNALLQKDWLFAN